MKRSNDTSLMERVKVLSDYKEVKKYCNDGIAIGGVTNSASLHRALVCAEFYVRLAKADVVVSLNENGRVISRAVIWKNLVLKDKEGTVYSAPRLMDIVTTFDIDVDDPLSDYIKSDDELWSAVGKKIIAPKSLNKEYDESDIVIYTPLDIDPEYKGGFPYFTESIFSVVSVDEDGLWAKSRCDDSRWQENALIRTTYGLRRHKAICPYCGRIRSDFCKECNRDLTGCGPYRKTIFGPICTEEHVLVPGWGLVPKGCLDENNEPTRACQWAVMCDRLLKRGDY